MAKKYTDQGFKFIFVYTREAHPGENFPAHQTLEQKLDHARSLQTVLDVQRTILVDDVAGTGHELYGTLPNMTYVIDRGGKVLFRSDWTDPPTIERVLDYILDARKQRREGLRMAPFYSEMVGYRWSDLSKHHEVLERAGPQALSDWEGSQKRGAQQPPRPGRIQI
ncbi:MAG: hypothetical protein MK210_10905 [Dehalococcoidia bacterium]|jgi:hypothetical protein|nr:hypothetical protein [Dehalococcoidia bacterium]